jgi:hypothetical protein
LLVVVTSCAFVNVSAAVPVVVIVGTNVVGVRVVLERGQRPPGNPRPRA